MTDMVQRLRGAGLPVVSKRTRTILIVLAVCVIAPPLLARADILSSFRASVIGYGACFALMAISLNILMGYAGQISLGHAALLGIGAYTSGLLTGRLGWSYLITLPFAAGAGALLAFVAGLPALRLRGLYLAITTIGLVFFAENTLYQLPWQGGGPVMLPRPVAGRFIFLIDGDFLALILVTLVAFWWLDVNLVRSRLGRAFHAIREDEQVAQSFGIDVTRFKLLAFVISGALAGIAGMTYGHLVGTVASDVFDYQFSLLLVTFVVIGGLGSRAGVVIAAFLFGFFPRLLTALKDWDLLVGAFLLIYTLAKHPGGFAGAIREGKEAKAAKAARAGLAGDTDEQAVPALPRTGLAPAAVAADAPPLLEVRDVQVAFGGLRAVDGASLTVPRGRIVGLIGPNGAGKTTLFNAISGFVKMQAGQVIYDGTSIQDLPPHQRAAMGIGRTFQLVGLARNLSVRENLLLAQHSHASYGTWHALAATPRRTREERELDERARAAIASLGFERYADVPVKHLSGGQQRIVEIAAALSTAPEMMMLDEPSAGMAPAVIESLAQRLRELRDDLGRTVLLIEHHIPLVLDVCDEVYVLNLGKVLAHGTPAEIVSDPTVVDAYLGSAGVKA
ncbi:MAG TPA: branched-chain amino acid ABC transporter ATP-binding protein/permease [Actinomycetota bacterium]|nr:branched-chain amino acid ABC transporter ATP-binding protein/permease [Actinomycetota bacterium]